MTDAPGEDDGGMAALTRGQRVFIGLGMSLVLVGALLAITSGNPTSPAGLLATVGFLGAIVGVRYAIKSATGETDYRIPPPVERRPGVTRVGSDIDVALREAASRHEGRAVRARDRVTGRLRTLAESLLDRDEVHPDDWPGAERTLGLLREGEEQPGGPIARWLGRDERFVERVESAVDTLEGLATREQAADGNGHDGPTTPMEGAWRTGRYRTGRWQGLAGLALLSLTTGAISRTAGPALAGAVLFGLAGYIRLSDPPPASLSIDRTFDQEAPEPGTPVTVTVTVENVGTRAMLDVRVIDDVPANLTVSEGSPRYATALAPGGQDAFAYTVRAAPGDHEFAAAHLELRDPSGERARCTSVATSESTLSADPSAPAESVPLHPQATGLTGRVSTDEGGTGVEFHSIRDYRRGDPLRRVDWNRLARTGELATRQFVEEHAATVVLLLDVRHGSASTPAPGELSTVDRSRLGATQLVTSLLRDGDRVGLATVETDQSWTAPGAGQLHRDRLEARLRSTPEADEWIDFDATRYVDQLRRRLPAESQLIALSSALDDEIVAVCRRLLAHGHAVTLVSPDPTTRATLGARVVRLERDLRLRALRRAGVRVVDWPYDEDLAVTLERAKRGWRR